MSTETNVQTFVHRLEEGGWAKWIRRALLVTAVLYVLSLWMFKESGFRGLGHAKAIEQAEIARELARGNGFSTKMIRPAAIWQFESNTGAFPKETIPDTFHAPLNPFINSFFLRLTRNSWTMKDTDLVYLNDRVLAAVQSGFFLLAVLVSYFCAKRLFDRRLAVLGMGLLLMCEAFWDFSMAGLPQMLMLFLFSCASYVMIRLLETRAAGGSTRLWSAALGALFGLLALTHALTLFLFAGALVCAALFLRPWGRDAAIMLATCSLLFGPWLVRNAQVCGNPLGLGWYSGLIQIRGSESKIMRTMALDEPLEGITPRIFTQKFRVQLIDQLSNLYRFLGCVLLAPVFFVALLHLFKKPETALFRWWIFIMWLFAAFGMAVVGLEPTEPMIAPVNLKANDLHILFVPLMTFYGLAFVLVLWSRLEIDLRLARISFLFGLFAVSSIPFLSQVIELHKAPGARVHWPPYVPPYITWLRDWTTEKEIIMSDLPWAVAWYADRKSLWLPMTRQEASSLNDYNRLGAPIVGLYLTPASGNKPFLEDVGREAGEFNAWAPFILHQPVEGFFLRSYTALPMFDECVFYADRIRWGKSGPR